MAHHVRLIKLSTPIWVKVQTQCYDLFVPGPSGIFLCDIVLLRADSFAFFSQTISTVLLHFFLKAVNYYCYHNESLYSININFLYLHDITMILTEFSTLLLFFEKRCQDKGLRSWHEVWNSSLFTYLTSRCLPMVSAIHHSNCNQKAKSSAIFHNASLVKENRISQLWVVRCLWG